MLPLSASAGVLFSLIEHVQSVFVGAVWMYKFKWIKSTSFLPSFAQDWERKHKTVVSIYRSHLLAAVQVRPINPNYLLQKHLLSYITLINPTVFDLTGSDGWRSSGAFAPNPSYDTKRSKLMLFDQWAIHRVQVNAKHTTEPNHISTVHREALKLWMTRYSFGTWQRLLYFLYVMIYEGEHW